MLSQFSVPAATHSAPRTKPALLAGSSKSAPIRTPLLRSTVSINATRSIDSLAFEASGPSFRPSLTTKTGNGKVSLEPPPQSIMSSGSPYSSSGVSRALLPQSDCVESASNQVGVLGAQAKSRSGSGTSSKRSRSQAQQDKQAAGSAGPSHHGGTGVQLSGVQKLPYPP